MKIGIPEILIVLAVALLVLGPDKLPVYMKKFGRAIRDLKKYSNDLTEDIKENVIDPLDEAQRPLKEAIAPLEELDSTLRSNVNDVKKSIKDIGKPSAQNKSSEKEETTEGNLSKSEVTGDISASDSLDTEVNSQTAAQENDNN